MPASVLMASILAAACGVLGAWPITLSAEAAVPVFPVSGRWSGKIWGIRGDAARCEEGGCTLTVDLVPCGKSWCGIEVKDGKTCGGVALRLDVDRENAGTAQLFKGTLELAEGTEKFQVQLSVHGPDEGRPATAHLVGNTGPELMLFRRSFPLEASLERIAEPTCTPDTEPPLT